MKRIVPKRTRFLLLFICGIGLPSLLLGYLAFRGVKNDQALIEKERVEEQRRLANRAVQALDQGLLTVEQAFQRALNEISAEAPFNLVLTLRAFKEGHPLVEEVFAFDIPTSIGFPCAPLLYQGQAGPSRTGANLLGREAVLAPDKGGAARVPGQEPRPGLVPLQSGSEGGPRYSNRSRSLDQDSPDPEKSGRLSSALETFRTISTDFDRVRSGTGPPLGLAARLETGALARDLDENEEALDVLFSLFDEMLNGRWELTKGEFEFAVQRTKELIEAVLSQGTADIDLPSSQEKYNALESRERAERLRTERYQLFQDEAHRVLGQQSSESNEGPSRRKMRFSLRPDRRHSWSASSLRSVLRPETSGPGGSSWMPASSGRRSSWTGCGLSSQATI